MTSSIHPSWRTCVPCDLNGDSYSGYVTAQGVEYLVKVTRDPADDRSWIFECDGALRQLLCGFEPILRNRLQQSREIGAFLMELNVLLDRVSINNHSKASLPPKSFYSTILDEIESVGWSEVVSVDLERRTLILQAKDKGKRLHELKIVFPAQYPAEMPFCSGNLPLPLNIVLSNLTEENHITAAYKQFINALEPFQELWNQLDILDQKAWILEPKHVGRNVTSRRLALGNHASLHVDLSAQNPRGIPECRFVGADSVVGPLRTRMNENIEQWDERRSVFDNLEKVLGTQLPVEKAAGNEDEAHSVECGICYAFLLGEEVPENACEDARCGKPFHRSCLVEWLRSLPSCRISFNKIYGECPYCGTAISTKLINKPT